MIKKGNIVLHTLSRLYYYCENKHHERWMNQNPYYKLVSKEEAPPSEYFKKGKYPNPLQENP